jgi:hypothetical protein
MLDEAARWDDLVVGLRLMSYGAKGVPACCLVSVGPTTAAKASSEGWRLRLHPNMGSGHNTCSAEAGCRGSFVFLLLVSLPMGRSNVFIKLEKPNGWL